MDAKQEIKETNKIECSDPYKIFFTCLTGDVNSCKIIDGPCSRSFACKSSDKISFPCPSGQGCRGSHLGNYKGTSLNSSKHLSNCYTMATVKQSDEQQGVYPAVAMYGPCTVRGLQEGEVKLWCRCGLSKKQPWCDGSHKGTGFKPLRWVVPKTQTVYEICACKYTKDPPICDATHVKLPEDYIERSEHCSKKDGHSRDCKLCTDCGWVPDF